MALSLTYQSDAFTVLLVTELWSVIVWYNAGFYAYEAKNLIIAEERNNMIFGKFDGTYHICTQKRDVYITKLCLIDYLKNRQEVIELVKIDK
jgi:hypothetical protein